VSKAEKEARSISLRVRITPKLLRDLKRLADDNRRTISNYVCVVLEEHVAETNERTHKRG
jgi:mRNA-degrading endonuclease RelE of RelBE toxin-antitoxin system